MPLSVREGRPWLAFIGPLLIGISLIFPAAAFAQDPGSPVVQEYSVQPGSGPHDAVPDATGFVWYTGQRDGTLGRLDPRTGEYTLIALGPGSAPHGVVIGPDGAPWVTDGGQNAILRVDPASFDVLVFPLPGRNANLNTPAFDLRGVLWFTGQNGVIGRLDPSVGVVEVWNAPRGPGAYGISTAPDGTVYFASLASSYLGRIDGDDGSMVALDPPTPRQGTRRVWPDSAGRLWISEFNAGQLGRYDPVTGEWAEWRLPGDRPQAYAVYVDERDQVWLSDTRADTIVRFDPNTETYTTVPISRPSNVAQLGGVNSWVMKALAAPFAYSDPSDTTQPVEIWGAERGRDAVFVVRYQ